MIPPHVPTFEEHARTLENVPIEARVFEQAVAVGSAEHRLGMDQGS
jgi:hypothetical protein